MHALNLQKTQDLLLSVAAWQRWKSCRLEIFQFPGHKFQWSLKRFDLSSNKPPKITTNNVHIVSDLFGKECMHACMHGLHDSSGPYNIFIHFRTLFCCTSFVFNTFSFSPIYREKKPLSPPIVAKGCLDKMILQSRRKGVCVGGGGGILPWAKRLGTWEYISPISISK